MARLGTFRRRNTDANLKTAMNQSNTLRKVRRELAKGWRKLLPDSTTTPAWPEDFSDELIALCRTVAPYTMTSRERVATLVRAVDYVVAQAIPGDFVECGVAAGGSSMAMALALLAHGVNDRGLWLYDTFEGMPEPGEHVLGRYGANAIQTYRKRQVGGKSTWINISLETVQENMARTGYPAARVTYVKGKVESTLAERPPERVSMLRCDTDWYESTKAELEVLWPRLSPGGIVLFDDYYRWQGSRKAADDYFKANGIRIFLARIDAHAAIGVKQF